MQLGSVKFELSLFDFRQNEVFRGATCHCFFLVTGCRCIKNTILEMLTDCFGICILLAVSFNLAYAKSAQSCASCAQARGIKPSKQEIRRHSSRFVAKPFHCSRLPPPLVSSICYVNMCLWDYEERYDGRREYGTQNAENALVDYNNGDVYSESLDYNFEGRQTVFGEYFFSIDGKTYKGEFERGIMQGNGALAMLDGSVYDGNGEFRFSNGDAHYVSAVNGAAHGHGRYIFKSGHSIEGVWNMGSGPVKNNLAKSHSVSKMKAKSDSCPGRKRQNTKIIYLFMSFAVKTFKLLQVNL